MPNRNGRYCLQDAGSVLQQAAESALQQAADPNLDTRLAPCSG
jgi:hypothetical protein